MSDFFLVNKADRIVTITLNQPERLNPLSRDTRRGLIPILDEYGNDESVSVIVIKGAGKAFSAGADIHSPGPVGSGKELHPAKDVLEDWEFATEGQQFLYKIWDTPRPIIAQVHGVALGMGFLTALACDLIVTAEDAKFGNARMMMGGGMMGKKYVWYMGIHRAKWMDLLPGWRITGKEAVEWGLANLAVPADKLDEEVSALAHALASYPLYQLKIRKKADNRVWEELGFRSSWDSGIEWDAIGHKSKGGQEQEDKLSKLGWRQAFGHYADYPKRHGHD